MLGLGFTKQILTLTKIYFCAGKAGAKAFLVYSYYDLSIVIRNSIFSKESLVYLYYLIVIPLPSAKVFCGAWHWMAPSARHLLSRKPYSATYCSSGRLWTYNSYFKYRSPLYQHSYPTVML